MDGPFGYGSISTPLIHVQDPAEPQSDMHNSRLFVKGSLAQSSTTLHGTVLKTGVCICIAHYPPRLTVCDGTDNRTMDIR
jgi:hypothetical protein